MLLGWIWWREGRFVVWRGFLPTCFLGSVFKSTPLKLYSLFVCLFSIGLLEQILFIVIVTCSGYLTGSNQNTKNLVLHVVPVLEKWQINFFSQLLLKNLLAKVLFCFSLRSIRFEFLQIVEMWNESYVCSKYIYYSIFTQPCHHSSLNWEM